MSDKHTESHRYRCQGKFSEIKMFLTAAYKYQKKSTALQPFAVMFVYIGQA